ADVNWQPQAMTFLLGALLADIGMLGLNSAAFAHDGPLTDEQRTQIDRHPLIGAEWVQRIAGLPGDCVAMVLHHHERHNGSGYPAGKSESQLEPVKQLLAVADSYTARREDRPHRSATSPKQALTDVLAEAEAGLLHLDWARLLLNLSLYPVGSLV